MSGNVFDVIGGASPTRGGSIITDGSYVFAVEKIAVQNGFEGTCFIAELRVMEAQPASVAASQLNANERPPAPSPVGSVVSLVCNLSKHQNAKGNAKAFLVGVYGGLGYTEAQVTGELSAYACSDGQPLRGALVRDVTYRKQNRGRTNPNNAGIWMVLHNWQAVPQTAEDIKRVRAHLDGTAAAPAPAPAPAVTQPAVTQPAVSVGPATGTIAPAPATQVIQAPAPAVTQIAAPPPAPATAPAGIGGVLGTLGIK